MEKGNGLTLFLGQRLLEIVGDRKVIGKPPMILEDGEIAVVRLAPPLAFPPFQREKREED